MMPLDLKETAAILREKLLNGWFLVTGNQKGIQKLENHIYTPNTDKNADFIAIMLPTFPGIKILYFGKKTKDLREHLKQLSDYEYDTLIGLEFHFAKGENFISECLFLKPEYREARIDGIVKKMLECE